MLSETISVVGTTSIAMLLVAIEFMEHAGEGGCSSFMKLPGLLTQ